MQVDSNAVSNDVHAFQADGIVFLQSKRARSRATARASNAWNGIAVIDSPEAHIEDNRTERNVNSGILVANAPGVRIDGNRSNRHEHPDTGGIVVSATENATITDNRTNGNTTGISLELGAASAKVARNTVSGGGDGIALLESDGNTVERNTVSSVGGVGSDLDAFGPPDATPNGSDDNTIARNQVKASGLAGIAIFGASDGNRLTSNVATSSHGDGSNGDPAGGSTSRPPPPTSSTATRRARTPPTASTSSSAGNTVKATTATDNLRRGIEAVEGTIDGGGNHASGNGLEPQCTGVACA